ncbi:hypothetical protein [Pseudomonas chlororaphis]|uniref:hypothetical protein n=1 Tax=Pseudomonas chlororaphis TaxID=587753 RepID=UPI000BE43765|nr:hypothetical protein [Pseudomonas chlororaphis]
MNPMTRVALLISVLAFAASASAEEKAKESVTDVLVAAKFSGGCGILVQMASFQKSTKMPGGDDFLERFLKTESARTGFTVSRYLELCQQSAQVYQTYYDELEKASSL